MRRIIRRPHRGSPFWFLSLLLCAAVAAPAPPSNVSPVERDWIPPAATRLSDAPAPKPGDAVGQPSSTQVLLCRATVPTGAVVPRGPKKETIYFAIAPFAPGDAKGAFAKYVAGKYAVQPVTTCETSTREHAQQNLDADRRWRPEIRTFVDTGWTYAP